MNILVVDDQPDVVKGIISGVNWEKIGIKNVYGAESAKQAKEILSQKNIKPKKYRYIVNRYRNATRKRYTIN